MTREIREAQTNRPGSDRVDADGPVALVIGDGREDWMLPEEAFEGAGCQLIRAEGFSQAEETCALVAPDLVFMPLTLEGKLTSGHLRKCLSRDPVPVVVVVASNDQINTAAEAMRLGAYDCLFKPFSRSRLVRTIEAAVKQLRRDPPAPKPATRPSRPMTPARRADPAAPDARPEPALDAPVAARGTAPGNGRDIGRGIGRGIDSLNLARRGFVASSPHMRAALDKAAIVAQSDATVFISGEVGTGKTTLAGIVHELSPRAFQPLVTVTCATLTAQEFERRISGPQGALARAAGGTLYLDEIVDLSAEVQPKVLRLIDGPDTGAAGPGVRVIVSTGHDPGTALRDGRIRPELFYRLHVAPIELPPLRDREGDPALIARVRLAEFAEAEGRSFVGFSDTAVAMISQYDWPGNLRELVNVIHTVVLMNQGPMVTPELLPRTLRASLRPTEARPGDSAASARPRRPGSPSADIPPDTLIGKTLAEIERAVIEATIRAEDGSVPRAARVLDVSPSTLYRKREAWAKAVKD